MIWLLLLCIICLVISILLIIKIILMRKSIQTINEDFTEKLTSDTNTLLLISSNDKTIRRLASNMNTQLKLLRKKHLRYEQGDLELKSAITNISHDLRTPLTAILGYLELIENEQKSPKAEAYLHIIQERTIALKELIDELFRYSIISCPDYSAPKEKLSLNAILEESIAEQYSALQKANIIPKIDLPQKIVYCMGNRVAITRILSNLIQNAIKYSDGDLYIQLELTGQIIFSNFASNLNEVQVKRLFDRFYTVESGRKSTGLGLSIVKVLVEQLEGSIDAKYQEGRLIMDIHIPILHSSQ